jgi:DNA polymerase-3 subunit epsilon
MYAVVDIETTGSHAGEGAITEICILITDGERLIERWESLVNPEMPIPPFVQRLTGITDRMVSKAPAFRELAETVYEKLNGKIFVAHNVQFDHSFIDTGLQRNGYWLQGKRLCTVRLSQKIFPGQVSYSLGKLCRSLDIPLSERHRAAGDALATLELFHRLLKNDMQGLIAKSLPKSRSETKWPPNVPLADIDRLPYTPGVYYFLNQEGKAVYIGKAKNIRYRVNSHFTGRTLTRQRLRFMEHVHRIQYRECATDLMAQVLESIEIKHQWPKFNAAQKNREEVYGIFRFEDQQGYLRLAINKVRSGEQPIRTFHYLTDGQSLIRKLIQQHTLCPKLCFLQRSSIPCQEKSAGNCWGACESVEAPEGYNARVVEAIRTLRQSPSFILVDRGIKEGERSCILVVEGAFYGMGYLKNNHPMDRKYLEKKIPRMRENSFVRNLILGHASRFPEKVIEIR